jgi:thioredoxin-like negative regulator of GroEL
MTSYIIAFVAGVAIAWFLTQAPELRTWRLFQLVLLPAIFLMMVALCQGGGQPNMAGGVAMVLLIVFVAFLLAPNIAYHCGVGVSNFLDPMDWTPVEEIALRPIRRLIDKDRFYEALGDLETLLKKHKPTHEALLMYAKLLHHMGRIEDTSSALLKSLPLAHTADQQLVITQLLAELPAPPPAGLTASQTPRHFSIAHELIVFPPAAVRPVLRPLRRSPSEGGSFSEGGNPQWKLLPPGEYEVRESILDGRLWFVLVGEDWGNTAACWKAVHHADEPVPPPPKKGFLQSVARAHQAVFTAIKGRPRHHQQADANKLFKEAVQFIRREDWRSAQSLLEKANAGDPHRYEIAYRWVQAVRQNSGRPAATAALKKVLEQAQWSENEREMLQQAVQK